MIRTFSIRCNLLLAISISMVLSSTPQRTNAGGAPVNKPNILFCISDDQSWLHAGAYGDKVVATPNFDRLAKESVLFTHAFCAAPTCTASRSAILTGQHIWRLEEGGVLFGALPAKFKTFPRLLEKNGYFVGFTGKGWSPGNWQAGGWKCNPTGTEYNNKKYDKRPLTGIQLFDYAANFEEFLKDRPEHRPFCFWYGCTEPHRNYDKGSGLRAGKKLEDVKVPGFLPDRPEIRSDILDYYMEIEWFDKHLGRMIEMLERIGELDNTIIVVTSDNGMPFPKGKATLYDYGVRMPLVIRWGAKVSGGRVVEDLVSLTDLAPTFIQAAGVEIPMDVTGQSLLNILLSDKAGRVDLSRDRVFTALERHAWARPDGATYPMRAIRTHRWLYIRNYEPDRWPAGDPDFISSHMGTYGEIDNGPTKTYMMKHKDEPDIAPLFQMGFGKHPAEELYDVRKDPFQMNNLVGDPMMAETRKTLRDQLDQYLRDTNDPRADGQSPWDKYPYYHKDYWKRAVPSSGKARGPTD